MIKAKTVALMGTAALLCCGCISTERELRIDYDLNAMKSRMAAVEQGLAGQADKRSEQQLQTQVDGMAKRQADFQAGQEALRVEMQTLRGLIEDTAGRRRELQDAESLSQQDLALRVANLDTRFGKLEKEVAELRVNLAKVAEQQSAAAPASNPEALYEEGRELVQKSGSATDGRAKLEEFVKLRPQSDLVPNALYWIGETYYSEKNFESAILQFQDVLEKYPTHPKASAALYKQALAFQALNEPKKTKALLQKLTEAYPKSEEAKKAKVQLDKMKKP